MRTAGIIRIIVGLVIAALLTAILIVLLTGNNIFSRVGGSNWIGNIIDRAVYTSGGYNEDTDSIVVSQEASVPVAGISKIKVDWVSGSVNLRVGTSDEIVFSESSYRQLTDRQKMRYTVSGSGVLQIHYCENLDNIFDWFNLDANMPAKTLTLEVPASLIGQLSELDIETVSANIDLSGVYGEKTELSTVSGEIRCADVAANELELDSTSGTLVCENSTANMLDLDNVSGSIRVEGEYGRIDIDTVSGSVNLALAVLPDRVDVDGVSGSITLALPENAAFSARLDTVSGSLNCEFEGTIGSDVVVVGGGGSEYRFNTVSGSVNIQKN